MKKGIFTKFLSMFTLFSLIIGLAACTHSNTAFGELTDDVYFQQGEYKITEKQLYELMLTHKSGSGFTFVSTLNKLVNEKVLAPYLEEVDQNWETEYKEKAKDLVKKSVYGTDEDEAIAKLASSAKKVQEKQFLDSQLTNGVVANDIFATNILENYKYQFATERFAKKILEVEINEEFILDEEGNKTEEKNPNYIGEEAIKNYYESNYKGKNDFSVITIGFTNLNEAEEALSSYETTIDSVSYKGLKSYKGNLYLVPANVNYNTLINESNIANYKNFNEVNGGKDLLLFFVELYTELYGYKTTITAADINSLKAKDFAGIVTELTTNEKFAEFQKDYEEFKTSNASLSSFVATNLKVENKEFEKQLPRYTATPASIGNTYYYAYKLTDGQDKELSTLEAEIKEELIKEKLTSAYINTKLAELQAELSYTIYDGNIQNVYKAANDDLKTTRKDGGNLLCKVQVAANEDLFLEEKTIEITVKELYEALEEKIGVNVALEAAYKNALVSSNKYDDKISKADIKEFKADIKALIKDFKNNSYATYGLPASVGEKTFLKLNFGVEDKDDLLKQYYTFNKKSDLYLKDIENNLKQNNNDYYETLAAYSKNYYEKYFSVSVGHILVYTDLDQDGAPDNPEKYTETQKTEFAQKAYDLQKYFHEEAKNLVGKLNSSMEYLANEFATANKFNTTVYNTTTGATFGDLKMAGFNAKYENLGAISLSNITSYDKVFADKVLSVYANVLEKNKDFDDEQEYLQDLTSVSDLATSTFGYHVIVISKIDDKENVSAKYTASDDYGKSYGELKYDGNDKTIDAYSENNYLSRNQIEVYMREKDLSGGIKNLPTDVKTACTTFVSPVLTKYESASNQFFLKLNLLGAFNFTDAANNNYLNLYKDYQVNVFFGYSLLENHSQSPLGTWFQDNFNYTVGGNN